MKTGWRNTDQLRWMMLFRTRTLQVQVRILITFTLLYQCVDPTNLVERFIEKNRLPHLLFYGPPGTGKTSTILAVARQIYGADYKKQILEVNETFVPNPKLG